MPQSVATSNSPSSGGGLQPIGVKLSHFSFADLNLDLDLDFDLGVYHPAWHEL